MWRPRKFSRQRNSRGSALRALGPRASVATDFIKSGAVGAPGALANACATTPIATAGENGSHYQSYLETPPLSYSVHWEKGTRKELLPLHSLHNILTAAAPSAHNRLMRPAPVGVGPTSPSMCRQASLVGARSQNRRRCREVTVVLIVVVHVVSAVTVAVIPPLERLRRIKGLSGVWHAFFAFQEDASQLLVTAKPWSVGGYLEIVLLLVPATSPL